MTPTDSATRLPDLRTIETADLELPEDVLRLRELAYNLWWCWSPSAQRLFRQIDPEHWQRYGNPVELLIGVGRERWSTLLGDPEFRRLYSAVIQDMDAYPDTARWLDETGNGLPGPVAYFSMEFGIHESLGVYSGGLGVLAGDHCKAASDLGVPLIGVSLLYRSGYFRQTVDADGYQQHIYPDYDFHRLPLLPLQAAGGGPLVVPVDLPGRVVQAKVWKAQVGLVPVLLLDTDLDVNDPADRAITSILYVRGREMRLCQEVVLGVGGVRALRALGVRPAVWHMNEGHVALLGLERARELVDAGEGLEAALETVSHSTVFTTHTPVPAGNETFDIELAQRYLDPWVRAVGCDPEEALRLGQSDGSFNMTALAIRLSAKANGVSRLHGEVSSSMWGHLLSDRGEFPIGHITNGVHTPSWIGPEMRRLFEAELGETWHEHLFDTEYWKAVENIPDERLWAVRRAQKERLIRFVRSRLRSQGARHGLSPDELRQLKQLLDPGALTIGFARRFATYKRAVLVLNDLERLGTILTSAERPVQILFAGKAHPADRAGQDLIRRLFQLTQGELRGHLVFLEDYDMQMGRMLVQGCDVWLNTPRRPQEASGTSGQKSPINGGINLSVLDGWWAEGYAEDNGWVIGDGEPVEDVDEHDRRDANSLYELLENEVIPLFFERGEDGLPHGWIARMKRSVQTIVPVFSAHRMVRDYVESTYRPVATHQD